MRNGLIGGTFLGFVLSTFAVLLTALIVGAMDGETFAILAATIGETYATWDFIHTTRGG